MKQQSSFQQLLHEIVRRESASQALNELSKDASSADVILRRYSDLLMSAASQYVNDLERVKERANHQLPDIKLRELESDLEALNRYLRR